MKLVPALVISLKLKWAFGHLNRIEEEDIEEYDAATNVDADHTPIVDPSSSALRGSTSDLGVLSMKNDRSTLVDDEGRHLAPKNQCPPEDIVVCDNGILVSVGGVPDTSSPPLPCKDGCGATGYPPAGGMCCNGPQSCNGFTGSVCKDGVSCSQDGGYGGGACYNANIPMVHRGCNGYGSCGGADLVLVQDACNNVIACGGANTNPPTEPAVCATDCCNEESECVGGGPNAITAASMIDLCGKCTGKQLNMFT